MRIYNEVGITELESSLLIEIIILIILTHIAKLLSVTVSL